VSEPDATVGRDPDDRGAHVILVTGATGNVGGRVAARLLDLEVPVRALTRDPAGARLPGAEIVGGDLSHADSLGAALDEVDTVFLVWHQASVEHPDAAIEAIAGHARRVVYLSSLTVRDELEVQTHPMTEIHAEIEDLIRGSGLAWTFLRAGTFASNALGWADEIRETGVVRLPYPQAGRSPIVADDIAAVAAHTLTDGGHDGMTHVLTGPEQLTLGKMVAAIGVAIGRPLRADAIPPEIARAELVARGASEELADAALAYWARLVAEPEPVTDTVARITGAPARTFASWARAHATAFV
jgi:uncharacterized protein YbjT (DUF2867 family)